MNTSSNTLKYFEDLLTEHGDIYAIHAGSKKVFDTAFIFALNECEAHGIEEKLFTVTAGSYF